jgi:hypothetical protein
MKAVTQIPLPVRDFLHYYILAFILLMGYYVAEYIGLTTWVFPKPLYILLPVLTAYYGTVILVFDKFLHWSLRLK